MNVADLYEFFDCVVVINLKRREDRWKRFLRNLPADWPFRYPLRFYGVDGTTVEVPDWWKPGSGAWGCYLSHRAIIKDCIERNINRVLILEDDAVAMPNLALDVRHFLGNLPDDWSMLYMGGQLLELDYQLPLQVNEWVYSPYNVNRTHAYALNSQKAMRSVLEFLETPECWLPNHHVDHRLGEYIKRFPDGVYVPRKWLLGQLDGASDVSCKNVGLRIFVNPEDAAKHVR